MSNWSTPFVSEMPEHSPCSSNVTKKKALHLALNVVRDENDARDLVQEAFLRAFRKIYDYSGDSAFYTWFYRIVYNLSVDFLRKPFRRRTSVERLEPILGELAPLALPRAFARTPDDVAYGAEVIERIVLALDELSEPHRVVIVLREIHGMSYGEIAEYLQCAKGTVMSRLFHARQRLQALLGDVHAEHFGDEVRTTSERSRTADYDDGAASLG